MARKKSGAPKKKKTKQLNLAAHLPADPQELETHCTVGWDAIKADTVHFGAKPFAQAAELDQDLKDLGSAITNAKNGGPPEKAVLEAADLKVRQTWHLLVKYVQSVLRNSPIEDVPPVLVNILMYESKVGQRKPKQPLAAKQGAVPGSVSLVALAILGALTYGWEWSLDETNWQSTTTGQAHVTLTGLTPEKVYYFRVRAFLRDNTTSAYTQTVHIMVH